jgi:hypothetical protein
MFRILLLIILLIATGAVVAHGTLRYRQAATASLIADEESTEQKSLLKEAKELGNEQIGFSLYYCKQALVATLYRTIIQKTLRYSRGFYDTPYNPPDIIC